MQTRPANAEPLQQGKGNDPERVIILADDLTGACDSGVAFLSSGRAVRVLLEVEELFAAERAILESEGSPAVWSFTTESRNLPVDEATRRLVAGMKRLPHEGSLFFKKVDSAARGHIGAEILASLRASEAVIALVAPAFPEAGRTVVEGILRVSDFSGQDATIPLLDLFAGETGVTIDILPDGDEGQLSAGLTDAVARGINVLLCGAQTQDHLHGLAAAGLQLGQPILWAGSAGLAHALAEALPRIAVQPATPPAVQPGKTLLFVGTPHLVTRLQMSRLDLSQETHEIEVGTTRADEVRATFSAAPVSALILTGGDTAAFVLRSIGASGIMLLGEVSRGIPWGIIQGGMADGCAVFTKSGGFGDPEALVRAFEFCERRLREST